MHFNTRKTQTKTIVAGLMAGLFLVSSGLTQTNPTKGKRTDVPMTRAEECLAVIDGIGQQSSFANLPDGSILLFSKGKFHSSTDGGLTWSEPWTPKYAGKTPSTDGSLIVFKDKTVGLVGRLIPPPPDVGPRPDDPEARDAWKKARRRVGAGTPDLQRTELWRSIDGGTNWSLPSRISPPAGFVVAALNATTIRAGSGRILVPVYGQGHLYVYRSDDEGVTWQRSKDWVRSFA